MKTENKIFRISVLVVGCVVYWIFFAAYWDSNWNGFYLVDVIDFKHSQVGLLIFSVIHGTPLWKVSQDFGVDFDHVENILLVIFNVGYFYCLWSYREDVVVLIKDLIKKI